MINVPVGSIKILDDNRVMIGTMVITLPEDVVINLRDFGPAGRPFDPGKKTFRGPEGPAESVEPPTSEMEVNTEC